MATITRDISYGSGFLQKADLYVPSGAPKGVILFIHGGGWNGGSKSASGFSAFLADGVTPEPAITGNNDTGITSLCDTYNYIVCSINYRLTSDGPTFGYGGSQDGFYPNNVSDVGTVLSYMTSGGPGAWATIHSYVTQYGLMVTGISAGGHLAMMGVGSSGIYPSNGVSNIVGPADLDYYNAPNSGLIGLVAKNLVDGYTQNGGSSTLQSASPRYQYGSNASPGPWHSSIQSSNLKFLFCYNTNDTLVPPTALIIPFINTLTSELGASRVISQPITQGSSGIPDSHNVDSDGVDLIPALAAVAFALSTTQAISTNTLTQNTAATAFTPVTASGGGGAKAFSISPALPTGLSFSTSTGAISGTPTVALSATSFTVTVTDNIGNSSNKSFSLTVTAATPTYTFGTYSTSVNEGGSVTLTVNTTNIANGTNLSWGVTSTFGDFDNPTGTFAINSNTGQFDINITADASTEGSETFTVNIYNGVTLVLTSNAITINDTSTTIGISNDATLSALTISSGTLTPSFSSGTTSYTASVSNGTSSVTVTPTRNNANATITVNGSSVSSGSPSGSISLNVGSNTITVVVTAQDSSTNTYTITVTREVTSPTYTFGIIPTSINEGSAGTFNVDTTNVANGTTLYWTIASNSGDFGTTSGSFTINSNAGSFTVTPTADLTTEGSETFTVAIRTGSTGGTVVATSNSVTINDTSVTIGISNDATLSALTISSSILTPTFSPDITSYTVSASNGTSSVTVTPTRNQSNATITVNGSSVSSGSASSAISLNVGSNTITVVVTAQDSSTNTYTITVTRVGIPTYSFGSIPTSINEGSAGTFNVDTTDVNNGTTLYWTIASNSGDFGTTSGSFTINSNAGSFTVTPTADSITEGSETFTVAIRTGSVGGTVVATSNSVTINDTSIRTTPVVTLISTQTVGLSVLNINKTFTPFAPITAIGGTAPLTYSISPVIVTGLNFNTSTGVISGTPTLLNERINYQITITDSGLGLDLQTRTVEYAIIVINELTTSLDIPKIILTATIPTAPFIPVSASGGYGAKTWSIYPALPQGLQYNSLTGAISGTARLGNTTTNYSVTIYDQATLDPDSVVPQGNFDLTVLPFKGLDVPKPWETTGTIGTLVPGEISELYVKGRFSTSTVYTNYSIVSGSLPNGLTLNRDGTIEGQVDVNTGVTTATSTSSFTVAINDTNNNNILNGEFSITVKQTDNTLYTNIYCKPFLKQSKRNEFLNFVRNEQIFVPNLIYRPFDSNFGKHEEIRLVIDFGVKREALIDYVLYSMLKNFYRRKVALGGLRTAVAKNSDGSVRHEIIYIDIIDKHVNSNKISVPTAITFNGTEYYPPSILNMRTRFAENTSLTTVRNPSFTNTTQEGESVKLGYISFVPLCFTLPGKSATIVRKINESGFKFNTFDFEMDRLIVENSLREVGTKYLLLNRSSKLA